jgi:hypothetical protein
MQVAMQKVVIEDQDIKLKDIDLKLKDALELVEQLQVCNEPFQLVV